MIEGLGRVMARVAARVVPDPFVLALGLTAVVVVAAAIHMAAGGVGAPTLALDGPSMWEIIRDGWVSGFVLPAGLTFALQMCLVLVTGHALALSPPVQYAIRRIATVPNSAPSATVLVAVVAVVAGVIHWGLAVIVGALMAREVGRHATHHGVKVHYPLLGAAAYSGLAVWHGGLSASAPLKMATPNPGFTAAVNDTVPVSLTLFGPLNLLVTGALVALIPLVYFLMTPRRDDDLVGPDAKQLAPLPARQSLASADMTAIERFQESWLVSGLIGAVGLFVVLHSLVEKSLKSEHFALDLDYVNLLFLFLGLMLQGGIRHYVEAVADGARGAGGIILQFPFYYGILGVMKTSGLIVGISAAMAAISTAETFPAVAFLSAGLVNLFVPSGGGQWAVQGEILLEAGSRLGVPSATTIMAFAYGDQWTNALQPFWALPLLGITGLRARDIIGYTAVIFLVMLVVVPVLLVAFALVAGGGVGAPSPL